MGWEIKGTLYKRKHLGGKSLYLKPSDPTPGVFFVVYQKDHKRHHLCLDTMDIHVARERWSERLAAIKAEHARPSENQQEAERRWLLRQVMAGEQAKARLHQITGPGSLLKIADAWQAFIDSKRRPVGTSPRTLAGYKQQFARFAKWSPGTIRTVRDLLPAHCAKYIADLDASTLSSGTINKHIGLLELVWKCVDPEWRNPWTGLHSTKESVMSHYRPFSLLECKRIYEAAEDEIKTLVLLGYSTGQRLGDLATLKWMAVDTENRAITIHHAKTTRRTGKQVVVPMTTQLFKVLAALPKEEGYVMPWVATAYLANPSGITKRIADIIDAAKVHDTQRGKASFHSFRHTFDSRLTDAGAPLQVCSRLLGHALPGMSDTYININPDVLRLWVVKAIKPL